jgi:hypothetical protein
MRVKGKVNEAIVSETVYAQVNNCVTIWNLSVFVIVMNALP